jgi:hypothetical protein
MLTFVLIFVACLVKSYVWLDLESDKLSETLLVISDFDAIKI